MKRHWIAFQEERAIGPMTFWVHRPRENVGNWSQAQTFDPPLPPYEPGEGYPLYHVEFDGFTFDFISLDEIRHCIEILSNPLLPRSIDLSNARGSDHGPNSHWLSRLPAKVKPWRYREGAVRYLRQALSDFESGQDH